MDAHSILIAQEWNDSWKDVHFLLARMEKDLAEWKAKEGVNPKSISIKTEQLNRLKHFVQVTGDLVQEQAEMLQYEKGLGYKHRQLKEDYAILYNYAKSKGIDISLLPYMTTRDFNVRL